MAQVSQQANPLHDEGKSKKTSEKLANYEKNWKEINGTKVYYDKVHFQVMADADKEDDTIDHFMDEVEAFINNNFKQLQDNETEDGEDKKLINNYYKIKVATPESCPYTIVEIRMLSFDIENGSRKTIFNTYTIEMIRGNIIKLADKHFGVRDLEIPSNKLDPAKSTLKAGTNYALGYDFKENSSMFGSVNSNAIFCGVRICNGGKCFGKTEEFYESLGPHVKKWVIGDGLEVYKGKKLAYPKGVIINYHLLNDMQGKEKIKQKNLPTELDYSAISIPNTSLSGEEDYSIYKINKSEDIKNFTDFIIHVGEDKEGNFKNEDIGIPSFWLKEAINGMEIGERAILRYNGPSPTAEVGNDKEDKETTAPKYLYVEYVGFTDTDFHCCKGKCSVKLGKQLSKVRNQMQLKGFERIACNDQVCQCVGLRSLCQCFLCLNAIVTLACFAE